MKNDMVKPKYDMGAFNSSARIAAAVLAARTQTCPVCVHGSEVDIDTLCDDLEVFNGLDVVR